MNITIQKKNIEDIIKSLSRVSLKGVIHPALKLSRINIKENKFFISSTNLSLAVIVNFPIDEVLEEKEYFVETESLVRTLSGMVNTEDVDFSFKESFIEIKTKIAKSKIPYQNGEDVPTIPTVDGEYITLPANNFKKVVSIVYPGASTTDIKPELSSILIVLKDNNITAVATDAFQLIEYSEKVTTNKELSFLVPAKEANDIIKIIDNFDGALSASYTDTLFCIDTKNIKIITKLTQGLFPDYTTIIPKNPTSNIQILRIDLDNALKFLMQLKSDTNHISFKVESNKLILSLKNSNGGDGEYVINVNQNGDDFSGLVMSNHLKTLSTNIPHESINLEFFGLNKPLLATNPGLNNFKYLLMPVSN